MKDDANLAFLSYFATAAQTSLGADGSSHVLCR